MVVLRWKIFSIPALMYSRIRTGRMHFRTRREAQKVLDGLVQSGWSECGYDIYSSGNDGYYFEKGDEYMEVRIRIY